MQTIHLQQKFRPRTASIEHYWFENAHTGLARTLFHRIIVPLDPLDFGIGSAEQPESTELVIEWIILGLADPALLNGITLSMDTHPDTEASIYMGGAHNGYRIEQLELTRSGDHYAMSCTGSVEFENEGVAANEHFEFRTDAVYRGEA